MLSAFIDDGYTDELYIAPEYGVHPEVRGTYRPVTPEERAQIVAAIKKAKDDAGAERRTAAILPKHLLSWSLTDKDGNAAPITVDRIRKLKWKLYNRLVSIVLYGFEGGDVDPQKSAEEKRAADERDDLANDGSGNPYQDVLAEADEKN